MLFYRTDATIAPTSQRVTLKNLLLLSICFALFGCTTIDISETSFLRPDQRPPAPETLGAGYVMEPVSVAHADGAVSRGIYLRSPQAIATVLYFGGNEFRLDREGKPVVEGLAKAGVDIVIFDHRGYGRSDGTPTAELLKTDAADLYRFVRAKVKNRVVVYGLSLGSFVAASVAETQPIDGVILEGAPTNAEDQVHALFPWYMSLFVHPRLAAELLAIDNVKALRGYDGPLLLLVGGQDELVPGSLQRSLYDQATTSRKEIHVFPAYGHKGLIASVEFPLVLRQFLANKVDAYAKIKTHKLSKPGV
jgi:pimeloyl-ACP methyl ester carboxylesterase